MKSFDIKDPPIKVYGIPYFEKKKVFQRLPDSILEKRPDLELIGRRCPGARVCFRTNADTFTVRISLKTLKPDVGMSIFSCQSAEVLIGPRQNPYYAGLVGPRNYETKAFENTFKKKQCMEDVTIFLPRNEIVESVEINVPENASLQEPTPYKYSEPIVFYGSSITEGGCCCNLINSYNAILSNRLDFDYYNMGFSGNCKGEIEVAEYLGRLSMSVFFLDYDHNAPTIEHLAETHEPFFKKIRELNPDLPIVIMTRPQAVYFEDNRIRRDIIRKTYENAINGGDKNVYFIDGERFFGDKERHLCTIDTVHPNDLGFHRMADVIEPVLKNILENSREVHQ